MALQEYIDAAQACGRLAMQRAVNAVLTALPQMGRRSSAGYCEDVQKNSREFDRVVSGGLCPGATFRRLDTTGDTSHRGLESA